MKIYISNIGDQVTEDSLSAVLSTFGKVNHLKIVTDPHTGNPKGAYVEMPDQVEAAMAISKLDGCFIDGRIIRARIFSVAS